MCTRFMAQFDMGSEKNQKTGGEKCYEFGWNPDPSNAAPEWQAVRLGWRSSDLTGACPLEGFVR
jgi:hypothetical protein